jgi:signal transduction histidine kinase/CheY-like chemotaxis protein/streptogramin lyase
MVKVLGLVVLICSAGFVLGRDREFGHPLFRTFTGHDYGQVGQILAVTQDPQGPMLFGCDHAILAFDNNRWQTIPLPGVGTIRSFAVDPRGTVWFSTGSEIGYLSRVHGQYYPVKVYSGAFGAGPQIVVDADRVYLSSETGLFIWSGGSMAQQSAEPLTPFSLARAHGRIQVGGENGSIYESDGNRFTRIADSPPDVKSGVIRAIVDCPIGEGIVVSTSGMFQRRGARLIPWKTDIDSLLNSSEIFTAKWILGKYLAVLLRDRGVYLLDREGSLVGSFTVNSGLADAGFEAVGEDRDGGLWVCTDTEITRIQSGIGYTEFDHELGLPKGFVTGVVRFHGKIYVTTQHGVSVLTAADKADPSHFIGFGQQIGRFYGLTVSGPTAFASADSGTYVLNTTTSGLERIGSGGMTIHRSSLDPMRVFIAAKAGVEAVRESNGQWSSEGLLSQLPAVLGITDDKNGILFVSTEDGGPYCVQLRNGGPPIFRDARVERVLDTEKKEAQISDGSMVKWQDQLVFVGDDRVWELSEGRNRLEPLALIEKSLPGKKIQLISRSQLSDEYVWVSSRPKDAGPEIGSEIGKLYVSGRYEPLAHAVTYPLGVINGVWDENVDGESVVWIAGDYGLMRAFADRLGFSRRKFELYPSQILTTDGAPVSIQNGNRLRLKYDDRDFEIRFGTDRYGVNNELYYEARLEGKVVHSWPLTTAAVWRSGGGLNEGTYLLHIQARDSDGVESREFTFAFTIDPPWYRTLWAETVSGSLVILAFYLFNRWRTWQMKIRERELIQTVNLRTRELREHEIELQNAKERAELAREQAESANRAKTAFLANVSHELRTPINSILGYAQILRRRLDLRDDARQELRTIFSSGEHLLEMINEMLDLARVESGKVSVSFRSLELPKFIAGIVDEFKLRAARGNLRFIHEIEGILPAWIETDPVRLRQVLYNLLGNAMKFTAYGEVAFRISVKAKQLRFEVKDTGKGIPKSDLPLLFKPFYQATNNHTIGQGVGLGLHISKQIVELLGGQITIASELGQGSTFSFGIPRRNADPVKPELPLPQIVGYEGRRRRILVVDDEPLNRSMLKDLLSTVGFDVAEADSPEAALRLLKDHFDAVISDIRMPGGYDGHAFCRRLRSSPATGNLVIIASSASVFADDQRLAQDSGFNDFLAKPVIEEELFDIVGRHLSLKWVDTAANQSAVTTIRP